MRRTALALAVVALVARVSRAEPSAERDVSVPRAEVLTLDGSPTEEAWASAPSLPCETRDGVTPVVKVLASGGRLWTLVDVAEDPGLPIGVRWLVGPEGLKSSADAVQLAYLPQDARAARYVARGPRGTGRTAYRVAGAADVRLSGRWTAEVSLPFEDLGLVTDVTPVRLSVLLTLRTPNRIASAPPGSAFASVEAFARLRPPEGGWSAGARPSLDAKAFADEDAADEQRVAAWGRFVQAWRASRGGGDGARARLMEPLDAAAAARPDLAFVHVARGEVLSALGDLAGARAAFLAALERVPSLREARWPLAQLDVAQWVELPDDRPSDFDTAFAAVEAAAKTRRADDPGVALARAVLHYRRGDFAEAAAGFGTVLGKWPVGEDTAEMANASRRYVERLAVERGYRRRDEEAGDLPRARLKTSKGDVVVELFERDAPNTVANFVWLARARFYDGTAFHRVVPFFMAQGGDPESKREGGRPGKGGPGYAIPTEPSDRLPFRGVIAMASMGKDTEGSQFFLTTGTSAHLEGKFSVFGRVLEGQDVVDRLVRGDRLVAVEVVRARDHEYRPTTVAGTPAPEPVPTPR